MENSIDNKYDVFISYSRKDYVDKEGNEIPGSVISIIRETLKKHGICYWMDEEGNLTAKKFASIIAGKIRESMAFLFVCSKNSVASRWVERELSVADAYDKHIIPFLCDDSFKDDKVIMYTAAVNRIEYNTNPENALNKLVSVIEGDKKGLEQHLLKEEIKGLVGDYQVHNAQQEMIVQQLISKNVDLGLRSKQCPVCDNTVLLNKSYCDKCGWQFPSLYSLDGRKTPICDESQLALARAHWHSLDNVVLLQQDIKRKEEEIEKEKRKNAELREQYEALKQHQEGANTRERVFTVEEASFKMIRVEGGSMGTFYIGETQVTQALWQAVMGNNPSRIKELNHPVECVSWYDICGKDGKGTDPNCFLYKLNRKKDKGFRLPMEAEWEYAALGGNKSKGYAYSGSDDMDMVAWYSGNSKNSTHPVKQLSPNELGIYDMSGNVWEWCEDLIDPSTSSRVLRGGGWNDLAKYCRVSYRDYDDPSIKFSDIGFRLVLPQ